MPEKRECHRSMSSNPQRSGVERTLDPDDWEEFRALSHRMLDDMLDYTRDIRDQKTGPPTKEAIEDIRVPLTAEGEGEDQVYEVFRRSILPHTVMLTSPRFWGIVAGQGSPYGMLAEMLRAGMNGAQEFTFAEAQVNAQVIEWIKQVLVGGGSEANFTGLAVARNAKAGTDVKADGLQGLPRRMVLYCGDETHLCLDRSVELLGLGNRALRRIPTDDDCRIRIDALEKAIKDDREQGFLPLCIIGCAGTVNTGAFDDLNSLADLAERERMWFHVDGVFGTWVRLSRTHRHLADGLERADSLAIDLHKWMNMPYGIGCTLVKDRRAHFSTFAYGHEAEYLKSAFDLSEDQLTNPHNLALPLSRNFSSLKAYMLLRAFGKRRYSDLIQQNLDQIGYLTRLIEVDPELERTASVASNIVCFRYVMPGLSEADLERLNRKVIEDLHQDAFLMISDTVVKGKYMLRACDVNHRTRHEDMAFLVDAVKRAGRRQSSLPQFEAE